MKKYIFLDIDGVLNLERNRVRMQKTYGAGRNDYFMNDIYDQESMLNLKIILERTDAYIILTSNRCMEESCVKKFNANLVLYEIDNYYIGKTDYLYEDHIKCPAIKKYIEDHNVESYVILDDFEPNIENTELNKNFIPINHLFGITKEDAVNIINKLN